MNTLRDHEHSHTGQQGFHCPIPECKAVFETKNRLTKHKRAHDEKIYLCGTGKCSEKFTKFSDYRKHQATSHLELECSTCNKLFKTHHNLKSHEATHTSDRILFPCSISSCDKVFTKKSNLKVHIQRIHEGLSPFTCPHETCGKKFRYKCSMQNHIQKIHKNDSKKRKKDQALRNAILAKKPKKELSVSESSDAVVESV